MYNHSYKVGADEGEKNTLGNGIKREWKKIKNNKHEHHLAAHI